MMAKGPVLIELEEGAATAVRLAYGSQGVSTWRYALASGASEHAGSGPGGGVRTARDFRLAVTTDFADVDFPAGTLSPTQKERTDDGWTLLWDHGTLVASADLGDIMRSFLSSRSRRSLASTHICLSRIRASSSSRSFLNSLPSPSFDISWMSLR